MLLEATTGKGCCVQMLPGGFLGESVCNRNMNPLWSDVPARECTLHMPKACCYCWFLIFQG